MKNEVMNNVTRTLNRAKFQCKKHSPEILLVIGIASGLAGAVMACKATLKVNEVLDESKTNINRVHEATENGETDGGVSYDLEDAKKDLTLIYAKTGVELAKLYAPAVAFGVVSVTSILASNNIMHKRNAAMAAAYTSVFQGFKEYRKRVVERVGADMDHEFLNNIKAQEITEIVVDGKGKEKEVKKTVQTLDPLASSPYTRYFTSNNPNWQAVLDYNEMFLRGQQDYANDKLRAEGFLTLNDVCDMLGLETSKEGMVIGWIYNTKNPTGDNYVDFDIRQVCLRRENGVDFDIAYALDFNVDGNIYNMM